MGGWRVDVTAGGRGDEDQVGFARLEVATEHLARSLTLGCRVLEPATLEHAERPRAEHGGDDHEQHRERQHESSTADGELPQCGEHGAIVRLLAVGTSDDERFRDRTMDRPPTVLRSRDR